MKTLTSPPALRKRTLALAISSLLCAPFAAVHAANPPLVAGPSEHLIASGDYDSNGSFAAWQAFGGGSMTASGPVNVVNTLAGFPGVRVTDAGSPIDFEDGTVTSSAGSAQASNSASLNIRNTSLTTTGSGAFGSTGVAMTDAYTGTTVLQDVNIISPAPTGTPGWLVDGVGDALHMYESNNQNTNRSSLTTNADFSNAIQVANGASALLEYTNLVTNGYGSAGLAVDGSGSTVHMTGSTISTTGRQSHAVVATNGSSVVLNNTALSATGTSSDGISATGAGSSVVMNGGQIQSTAASINADSGASVELNGTTINNTRGQAVMANGHGTNVTLNNTNIVQTGTNIFSVWISNGSNLTMSGGSLTVSGNGGGAGGVLVQGTDAFNPTTANVNGTRIEIAADTSSSPALQVDGNAHVTLNQANLITRGQSSYAAWQTSNAATTTLTDTTIHTYGNNGSGIVDSAGLINVNGGSITTEGSRAHGLYADDSMTGGASHAILNANNVNVTTHGSGAYGAVARAGSAMSVTGGSITTNGDGAAAVLANGMGVNSTQLTLDGTQILTTGTATHGIHATNAAQLDAHNVNIRTTGSGSYGVYVANDPTVILNNVAVQSDVGGGIAAVAATTGISKTINANRLQVQALQGEAISSMGGSVDLNINGGYLDGATLIHVADNVIDPATTIAAGTTNLNVSNTYLNGTVGAIVDSGTLNLNLAQSSSLNGDINVTGPAATANLDLLTGSQFTGAAHGVNQINIDASSNWQLTGDSTVNTTTNAGTVAFAASNGFKTLSTRDYVGHNGTMVMNTQLGDDHSASDKLVIDGGHASGTTTLMVNNAGGTGAQTNNGILLVDAVNGGTTDATAFKLGNDVRAGAYDYRLFRSGLSADQADNWYLRSTFDNPVHPGDEDILPPEKLHIYGPELSVYGAVAPTASRLGQATLGTLHERAGEQENLRADSTSSDKNTVLTGAWGRMFGQSYQDRYVSIVSPETKTTIAGFQIGADLYRHQRDDGQRDHAGVYFAIGNAAAKVTGTVTNAEATAYVTQRTGTINLTGVSGGAYWTHYGTSGWYTDAVLQATSYRGTASSNRTSIGLDGSGLIASLDGGYPFQIGNGLNGLSLEPQAQIMYQHIRLDNTADQFSSIGLGSGSSLLVRLGARLQLTRKDGDTLLQPYTRLNFWSTLANGRNTVDYGGIDQIETKAGGNWTQVGIGMTAKLNQQTSLYGGLDGLFRMGSKEQSHTGVQATFGLRMNW